MVHNCCAGIVLYNPDIDRLEKNIGAVIEQIDILFIVDNNSDNKQDIKRLLKDNEKIVFIENPDNYGIARALNQVCEEASHNSYQWILTLDQDTIIPDQMLYTFMQYVDDAGIGIICPGVYYEGWGKEKKGNSDTDEVYACMTSASLTRIDAWRVVGGFKEDFFIDFVDNEFCMRLSLHGYRILRINRCMISHQLGDIREKKLFGIIKVKCVNHSAIRLYYMARNNYWFIQKYSKHLNRIKELIKLCYVMLGNIVGSDNKRKALVYINNGIRDAKNNRLGKYDSVM